VRQSLERSSSGVSRRTISTRAGAPPRGRRAQAPARGAARRQLEPRPQLVTRSLLPCAEAVAQTPAVVEDDNGGRDGLPVDVQETAYTAEETPVSDRLHWRDQQRQRDSARLCNSLREERSSSKGIDTARRSRPPAAGPARDKASVSGRPTMTLALRRGCRTKAPVIRCINQSWDNGCRRPVIGAFSWGRRRGSRLKAACSSHRFSCRLSARVCATASGKSASEFGLRGTAASARDALGRSAVISANGAEASRVCFGGSVDEPPAGRPSLSTRAPCSAH
jgi:hypothetical protein